MSIREQTEQNPTTGDMPAIQIGQPAWIFDTNRRIYGEDRSRPIWIEHWRKLAVCGQTQNSWLIGRESQIGSISSRSSVASIPKTGPIPGNISLSWAEIEARAWVEGNVHQIAERVLSTTSPATLKAVAELLGVECAPPRNRVPKRYCADEFHRTSNPTSTKSTNKG